jgi:hypothetical protein
VPGDIDDIQSGPSTYLVICIVPIQMTLGTRPL